MILVLIIVRKDAQLTIAGALTAYDNDNVDVSYAADDDDFDVIIMMVVNNNNNVDDGETISEVEKPCSSTKSNTCLSIPLS